MEHSERSYFATSTNPLEYASIKASVLCFISAKVAFSASSSSHKSTAKRIVQGLEVRQRKADDKVLALAFQLPDLTVNVKNLRRVTVFDSERTLDRVGSYGVESSSLAMNFPTNEHRKQRCAYFGAVRHFEFR